MSTDYAPAAWRPSPNFGYGQGTHGRGGHRVVAIVDHITAGSAASAISWFVSDASQVSSHYLVAKSGQVTQFVLEADAAWACGLDFDKGYATYLSNRNIPWIDACWRNAVSPNAVSISIEHEALVGEGLTELQLAASAALHRHLCEAHAIAPNRAWIVGHSAIDAVNRPADPGPAFPWDRLLLLVAGVVTTPPDYERYRPALDRLWERAQVMRQLAGQVEGDVIDLKRLLGFAD